MESSTLPVIIYSMGKVGSTSTVAAIQATGLEVLHVHELRPDVLKTRIASLVSNGLGVPKHLKTSQRILDLGLLGGHQDLRIITMIRPLLSRNISAFCQQLPQLLLTSPDYQKAVKLPQWAYGMARLPLLPLEVRFDLFRRVTASLIMRQPDALVELFEHHYPHHIAMRWMEDQFSAAIGMDAYAQPFDKIRGHQVLAQDDLRVLILDSTRSNDQLSSAIADFLGIPHAHIRLSEVSVTQRRSYAQIALMLTNKRDDFSQLAAKLSACTYSQHFYDGRVV